MCSQKYNSGVNSLSASQKRWSLLSPWLVAGFIGNLTMGGVAIASSSGSGGALTDWRLDATSGQLEIGVQSETKPRYFLMAQPTRIVVDLPNTSVGSVKTQQSFSGTVRLVRVSQFQPGLTRIVLELSPDVVLAPEQVQVQSVGGAASSTSGKRWVVRPLLAKDAGAPAASSDPVPPSPGAPATPAKSAATDPQSVAVIGTAGTAPLTVPSAANPTPDNGATQAAPLPSIVITPSRQPVQPQKAAESAPTLTIPLPSGSPQATTLPKPAVKSAPASGTVSSGAASPLPPPPPLDQERPSLIQDRLGQSPSSLNQAASGSLETAPTSQPPSPPDASAALPLSSSSTALALGPLSVNKPPMLVPAAPVQVNQPAPATSKPNANGKTAPATSSANNPVVIVKPATLSAPVTVPDASLDLAIDTTGAVAIAVPPPAKSPSQTAVAPPATLPAKVQLTQSRPTAKPPSAAIPPAPASTVVPASRVTSAGTGSSQPVPVTKTAPGASATSGSQVSASDLPSTLAAPSTQTKPRISVPPIGQTSSPSVPPATASASPSAPASPLPIKAIPPMNPPAQVKASPQPPVATGPVAAVPVVPATVLPPLAMPGASPAMPVVSVPTQATEPTPLPAPAPVVIVPPATVTPPIAAPGVPTIPGTVVPLPNASAVPVQMAAAPLVASPRVSTIPGTVVPLSSAAPVPAQMVAVPPVAAPAATTIPGTVVPLSNASAANLPPLQSSSVRPAVSTVAAPPTFSGPTPGLVSANSFPQPTSLSSTSVLAGAPTLQPLTAPLPTGLVSPTLSPAGSAPLVTVPPLQPGVAPAAMPMPSLSPPAMPGMPTVTPAGNPPPLQMPAGSPTSVQPMSAPMPNALPAAMPGMPTVTPVGNLPPLQMPGVPTVAQPLTAPVPTSPVPSPVQPATVQPLMGPLVEFGQPLPVYRAQPLNTSLAPIAPGAPANPFQLSGPRVLLPAGTTLNLRYPGAMPLDLKTLPFQQAEVLLLQSSLVDIQGNVLAPEGSPVVGQFVNTESGSRFITQAIALRGQNVPLQAESEPLTGRQVDQTKLLIGSGVGALAIGLASSSGWGALGGAATGAAASYFLTPNYTSVQPGQIVTVRLTEDLR